MTAGLTASNGGTIDHGKANPRRSPKRDRAIDGRTVDLAGEKRGSEEHTLWLIKTLAFLEDVFGRSSRFYLSLAAIRWYREGSFTLPFEAWQDPSAAVEQEHQRSYAEKLGTACGLLRAAKDRLQSAEHLEQVYEGSNAGSAAGDLIKVVNLAEFKLRKVIRDVPTAEVHVQDAFEGLLIGADIPYSRELGGIEYSSKTYTPDFTMATLDLVVEVKLCTTAAHEKALIPQINDDILAYQTKFRNVVFVVYDVGQIRDAERFTASFQEHENVIVRVVKH